MKRNAIYGFLIPLLLIPSSATGQPASIHQQIQQTYNFQPHLVSNRQITEKSPALDQLWTRAKAEPSQQAVRISDLRTGTCAPQREDRSETAGRGIG